MCLVCIDIIKQKMSVLEAERNLSELGRIEKDRRLATHYQDLYDALANGEWETVETILSEGESGDLK